MVNLLNWKEDATWVKNEGKKSLKVAYMVIELLKGGELFDYVVQDPFPESVVRLYFQQMLNVLHYFHNQGIAHRDLKPENMMLDDDFNLKVTDFGFAAPT